MEVQIRETCKSCGGSGFVSNPIYEELLELDRKTKKEKGRYLTNYEVDEWWSKRGYNPLEPPPEEYDCDDCEGAGQRTRWITLEEFKKLLK